MMKRVAITLFLFLTCAAPARAGAILYDNTGSAGGSIFSTSTTPRRAMDDGFFTPGPGAGGPVLVTALNIGYAFTGPGGGTMDIRVTFYDTLNVMAPAGTPVNSDVLGQVRIPVSFDDVQPPVRNTGVVDITGQTGGGIRFPDDNWAVDVEFLNPDTNRPSTRGTPLFAGGVGPNGPTVGNSLDRYWRDANTNGIFYDAGDQRNVGGGDNRANFYLQLVGNPVPEPATVILIAGSALALAWRHRR